MHSVSSSHLLDFSPCLTNPLQLLVCLQAARHFPLLLCHRDSNHRPFHHLSSIFPENVTNHFPFSFFIFYSSGVWFVLSHQLFIVLDHLIPKIELRHLLIDTDGLYHSSWIPSWFHSRKVEQVKYLFIAVSVLFSRRISKEISWRILQFHLEKDLQIAWRLTE